MHAFNIFIPASHLMRSVKIIIGYQIKVNASCFFHLKFVISYTIYSSYLIDALIMDVNDIQGFIWRPKTADSK